MCVTLDSGIALRFAISTVSNDIYSLFQYALSHEFYNERSFWFRLWYCVPNFFIFRMRIYIGVILSECVCSMVGLGAYPARLQPKPGAGPTAHFVHLKQL